MNKRLELTSGPELVFGLVAPIGIDLDMVTDVLSQLLREMNYDSHSFRLTKLMTEIPIGLPLATSPYIKSFKDRIAYANKVRDKLGDDALAALTISAIRTFRENYWKANFADTENSADMPNNHNNISTLEEAPIPKHAYIIRQLKRPDEIALFRTVYGRHFIAVSAYVPQTMRLRRIEEQERCSRGGIISPSECHKLAYDLVVQDSNEAQDEHGQNIRDAFPLGDVFIDASSLNACEHTLRRFIYLLFGDNQISPTHDEYGMYLAKSAALRSSDLSRQVGAAIFRPSGEVVALGCNEVPKAGGGTYWSGDTDDRRDFVEGFDANERRKIELLVDIIRRLKNRGHLSQALNELGDPYEIYKNLIIDDSVDGIQESQLMDIIEFGRTIHAEMSAVCDASRKGIPVEEGTLYTTTFPCHICAKHIVVAGIKKVVYLEPYPKSYASDLCRDSIQVESTDDPIKVAFVPFIGISPFRYRDFFEKGKRKYSGGLAKKWSRDTREPLVDSYFPMYFRFETAVVDSIKDGLEKLLAEIEDNGEPAASSRSGGGHAAPGGAKGGGAIDIDEDIPF